MEEKLIGRIPTINIKARNIAEGFYKATIACYEQGIRIQTPKHHEGGSLGYDAHITVEVTHPNEEPMICTPGLHDDQQGLMIYILEVTHGIHNHWKKDPNNPNDTHWGYTYNERFAPQIPFVLARIKKDYKEKGRISGRDYYFIIWDPKQDVIIEQEDPPCFQNGQLRFVEHERDLYLNYLTMWRSRDDIKAWNENNIAQNRLHRLLAAKISNMLEREVKVGSYIDTSDSLHIYGLYLDNNNYDRKIIRMRDEGLEKFCMSSKDYLDSVGGEKKLKRIIAAQEDAERKGHGEKTSQSQLIKLGYNLDTFEYPKDWDTWPKEWDVIPDKNKLF
ncbi:MAG: hypothetical protein WC413_00130 [Candidatus Nanoarchaeia archaeon]